MRWVVTHLDLKFDLIQFDLIQFDLIQFNWTSLMWLIAASLLSLPLLAFVFETLTSHHFYSIPFCSILFCFVLFCYVLSTLSLFISRCKIVKIEGNCVRRLSILDTSTLNLLCTTMADSNVHNCSLTIS